jgi:cytochrome c peroxidase
MTSSARPNSVIATVFSHNGSGTTFETVVDFYNDRFNMNLSQRDKADLVAFLTTL